MSHPEAAPLFIVIYRLVIIDMGYFKIVAMGDHLFNTLPNHLDNLNNLECGSRGLLQLL